MRDSQVAGTLIEAVGEADYLIANKGYDSEAIREKAAEFGYIIKIYIRHLPH